MCCVGVGGGGGDGTKPSATTIPGQGPVTYLSTFLVVMMVAGTPVNLH